MAKKKRKKKEEPVVSNGLSVLESNPSYSYGGIGEFRPKNRVKEVVRVLTQEDSTAPCLKCGSYKVYAVKEVMVHSVTGWIMERYTYQCAQCSFAMAWAADYFIPNERSN